MVIFFILFIVCVAAIVLLSLFAPQRLPWYRPHLILERSDLQPIHQPVFSRQQPVMVEDLAEPEGDLHPPLEENIAKLETILTEKNKLIERLQKELAAERAHRGEFDKVKSILDDEIIKLRLHNKELKTQAGEKQNG